MSKKHKKKKAASVRKYSISFEPLIIITDCKRQRNDVLNECMQIIEEAFHSMIRNKKLAASKCQIQRQPTSLETNLDESVRQKQEYIKLAMNLHIPLEIVKENYDILAQIDKHNNA